MIMIVDTKTSRGRGVLGGLGGECRPVKMSCMRVDRYKYSTKAGGWNETGNQERQERERRKRKEGTKGKKKGNYTNSPVDSPTLVEGTDKVVVTEVPDVVDAELLALDVGVPGLEGLDGVVEVDVEDEVVEVVLVVLVVVVVGGVEDGVELVVVGVVESAGGEETTEEVSNVNQ